MKNGIFVLAMLLAFISPVCAQETEGKEKGVNTKETKIKIIVGSRTLTATFYDNPAARAIIAKLPPTIPLQDLYAREMRYHFPEALPAGIVRTTGYKVGEVKPET
jgi:hypothetical protein